ncbi:alanine racemase [Vibrio natriegens]|uniref:alanine racemase n=1 Tax=Vibrio natriegens TaxID=691 RepID=UPI001593066C|nr:alanine racemase [Vibrio natriegens]NVC94742.1 alanine racemase [Vibrio natriegens]
MITAEAVINLKALSDNYDVLKNKCADKSVVAVIKGDAYGHNAVKTAKTLTQADMFAVSRIEEALELRSEGIKQPILLLEGCFCKADLETAAREGFHTAIHCKEQLEDLKQADITTPVKVWLKLDTGMHRLGIHPYELSDYVRQIEATNKLAGPVGFMSHFSCADDLSSPATQKQIDLFLSQTADFPGPKTLANSAGILYWSDSHLDYMRAGISLYGICPNENETGKEHGLHCVMTLNSKLIAIREHKANQPVGYGESWTSERDTNIGVVAMGYGDGYPRNAPVGTPVYINGRIVPISGRVSMDMVTVDLGPDATDAVGDTVEFWGDNLPIEKVAKHIGTIPYELVIKLTKRVRKTYVEV